ncbi:MAG: DMT family transporter [Methylobacteriaceae bacterium]|nr:DMT family transporter [Methylobacteriaceae bacterium]
MEEKGTQASGTVLVALAAVGWSMAGLFTRLVAGDSWAILGWRGLSSALAILAYLLWRERGDLRRPFASMGWLGVVAATVSTLASVAYIPALLFTIVANVAVIYATLPFVTAALGWALLREAPAATTLIRAAAAVVGVAIMVGFGGAGGGLAGIGLAGLMTLGMSLLTIISRAARGISMIPATGISAVQLAVIGAAATRLLDLSVHDILVLGVFGIVQAAALACYVEGAGRLTAARAALVSTLDVPLAPLWVLLFVGEIPAAATLIGGTIVLAAVLADIVALSRTNRRAA